MKISDLIGMPVQQRASGGTIGTCTDFLVDVDAAHIFYMLVDIGDTFNSVPALVLRDQIKIGDGVIDVDVSDAQIAARREMESDVDHAQIDLTQAPPVVVGPFGYTLAPAMAGALFNARANRHRETRPDIDKKKEGWHWYENLHGLPVFDGAGELGELDDVIVNSQSLACVSLTTRNSKGEFASFPFKSIRMVSRGENSIVLELNKEPPYSAEHIRHEVEGH